MAIKVCLAGATGWAGSELARGVAQADDLALVAAVSRTQAGRDLGEVLAEPRLRCPIYRSASEALVNPCDVVVAYTKPDSAKANIVEAREHGAHVVVGTSGLTDADFAEIDRVALEYTKPDSAKANIVEALEHGAHVVVGTSGLTDADFAEI